MTRVLVNLGWTAAMLAECATGCVKFLKYKLPGVALSLNVEHKPWTAWRKGGMLALIVVAGISCQPFSEAGPMKFDKDSRAWDAFHVIDAAIALQAAWVFLENVPNYVHKDPQHGVFTKLKAYALERGFVLVRVMFPRHDYCGGETYRSRVLIVFLRSELVESTDLSPLLEVTCDDGAVAEPTKYKLDKTRDWAVYGELVKKNGGNWLKFTTRVPVEGAVVTVDDSARPWRVQKRKRDSVDLMVTDRRASHRRNAVGVRKVKVDWTGIVSIACLALQVLQHEKVMRVFAWLVEAAAGEMVVEDYMKLAGLIGFARHALAMPKQTAAIVYEPLRAGFEKSKGPRTTIKSTSRRRTHWQLWSTRILTAHGAPCTRSLPKAVGGGSRSQQGFYLVPGCCCGRDQLPGAWGLLSRLVLGCPHHQ